MMQDAPAVSTPTRVNAAGSTVRPGAYAVDNDGDALTYSNGAWTTPHRVDTIAAPTSVSCASPSFCVAVLGSEYGGSYEMTFNGQRWTSPTPVAGKLGGAGDDLEQASCASASFCLAVGGNGHASVYDGRHWRSTRFTMARSDGEQVFCPTTTRCVVVDSTGTAYIYTA
jgi:hypothetical protein